jgi:hypothetical protein
MSLIECPRENDVIAAVASRRWPDRCDAELRDHVRFCPVCRDVAAVAVAFENFDEGESLPTVPSSAHMWWRLQMQARHDAARVAARPVAFAQATVAAAAAVTVGLVMTVLLWTTDMSWWSEVFGRVWSVDPAATDALFATTAPQTIFALGAIAIALVIMPIAVYFTLSD